MMKTLYAIFVAQLFFCEMVFANIDISYNLEKVVEVDDDIQNISFSPYDSNLIVSDDDGKVSLFSVNKAGDNNLIETGHSRITAMAVSPEQTFVVTGDRWGKIEVRNIVTGELVTTIEDEDKITALAISPDEKRLATGNSDGVVKIWNINFAKQIMEFKGHEDDIKSLYFLPGNRYLYSAGEDKTIRLWNLISKKEQKNIYETASKWGKMIDVSFSSNIIASGITEVKKNTVNRRLAVGPPKWSYIVKLRDLLSGEEYANLDAHIAPITSVKISKNQKYIFSASEDNTARIWSSKTGKLLSTIPLDDEVIDIAISPNNKWLAVATDDEKVSLYKLAFIDNSVTEDLMAGQNAIQNAKEKRANIYAVIIGISKYASDNVTPLEYAKADAKAIYDFLIDKNGQNLPKENVKLLIDEDATLINIKKALGSFLAKKATKKDTVIIYYAGHGAPETDIEGTSDDGVAKYIVNYDADPDDLFATAFPMHDLKRIFSRIQSDRVALFLDSCYSGAAGGRSFLSSNLKSRALRISRKFLDDNVPDGSGRVIITASRPNERSFELDKFGHGIFTYYLLDGLKGSADMNNNNNITLHELYTYLEERVSAKAQEIGGMQHPMMIGTFQGNFIRLQK